MAKKTLTMMLFVGGPADGQTFELDDELKGVTVPFKDGKTPGVSTYKYDRRRVGDRYVLASITETDDNLIRLMAKHQDQTAPALH